MAKTFKKAINILTTKWGQIRSSRWGQCKLTHRQISKLNQKAKKLYQQGRYEEAVQSVSQARDLSLQYLGEDHPDFAQSLNNLAELYRSMGNYTQAVPLSKEAVELRRKALGEDHPDFATSLNNLAVLYDSMGNYAQAEQLYEEVIEIRRKALGEDHPNFATSLNSLAVLYSSMGNYTQAESLCKRAMEIWRKALGENHPSFATSLNNLAGLYITTDRATEALPLMEQAASIDDLMIGQVFSIGSESQRMAYLKEVRGNLEGFISLISQHLSSSRAAINSAIELILRRKAIGAEALATQRDAVLGGRYPELEPELRNLINLRMQIAQKTLAGPGQEGLAEHQKTLSVWNKQKENLEAELVRQIPEMNLEQKLKQIDRQAIASTLPEGAALIEFVHFDVFDFKAVPAKGESEWKPARYLAFVILA
jgi:tetratricopeptide (TPR) repeat protein